MKTMGTRTFMVIFLLLVHCVDLLSLFVSHSALFYVFFVLCSFFFFLSFSFQKVGKSMKREVKAKWFTVKNICIVFLFLLSLSFFLFVLREQQHHHHRPSPSSSVIHSYNNNNNDDNEEEKRGIVEESKNNVDDVHDNIDNEEREEHREHDSLLRKHVMQVFYCHYFHLLFVSIPCSFVSS